MDDDDIIISSNSSGVCGVCRRAKTGCICQSHHVVRQMHAMHDARDAVLPIRTSEARTTEAQLNLAVNEAMLFYYNRDAEGLARWLRRVLR